MNGEVINVRIYCCIDLKSFYASVECRERGLDPLKTNLVVADKSRTEKTICLAVTPSLKAYGIPGRARLFEVVQKVNEINYKRKQKANKQEFADSSFNYTELKNNPNLKLDYIVAPPRMSKYMEYSISIYNIYLKYVSTEDIYPYSIDEVFIESDVTYLLNPSGNLSDHNTVRFGSGAGPIFSSECSNLNEFFVTSVLPSIPMPPMLSVTQTGSPTK